MYSKGNRFYFTADNITMSTSLSTTSLKREVVNVLKAQGYKIGRYGFVLPNNEKETLRKAHLLSKTERLLKQERFIRQHCDFILGSLINGIDLDVNKIDPILMQVHAGSKWEIMFKWWSYVWWSLPYEVSYGRQMRFIVWDRYNKSPIGLIGLQSPILNWAPRDNHLEIPSETRDYWVNQSLNAQRLGSLPPYNHIIGGKLVAMLLTSNSVRRAFAKKYKDRKTIIKNVQIPNRLLFVTTSGAYGKSPVYNRLRFYDDPVAKFVGFSDGMGSFHIPNYLYQNLVEYLESLKHDVSRGYGSGPSRKLRLIQEAMKRLGFKNGAKHNIKRGVYLFPLANNLREVISRNDRPCWYDRPTSKLTQFWKKRWSLPRLEQNSRYKKFNSHEFIEQSLQELDDLKKSYGINLNHYE